MANNTATARRLRRFKKVYKSSKNSDIRYRIKELLKAIGEEVFDFDDEEDDFEDLNDDE